MRIARATFLTALASCFVFVAVVASAQATPVVNGGFETGTLEGWQTAYLNHEEGQAGWPVVSGTEVPLSGNTVLAPFEGGFDAVADQQSPSALALYQDVALPAGETHELSLELNYRSYEPIAIPSPDTLEVNGEAGQPNHQVRVDVMKPGSSPFSLAPEDTLATLFASKGGDPEEMGWTHLTADLSAYAGQTVEIRVAVADNRLYLNAGVDAVRIDSTPIPVAPVTPAPTPPVTPAASPAAVTSVHAPVCTVPDLKGLKLTAARTALRAAGCGLGKGKVRRERGVSSKNGKVVKQWPQPGTLRAAGAISAVKLG